jgi:hypothetical protein
VSTPLPPLGDLPRQSPPPSDEELARVLPLAQGPSVLFVDRALLLAILGVLVAIFVVLVAKL